MAILATLITWFRAVCCKVGLHRWRTLETRFSKFKIIRPVVTRMILQARAQVCKHCSKQRVVRRTHRVAEDNSYPQRLFPEE
jgi:hypothetical protein